MQTYAVTLPHYSIGPEAYDHFDFVARFYGTRVAVIGGETALAKAGPALRAGFAKAGMTVTAWAVYGKDATNAAVERVLANDGVKTADVIENVCTACTHATRPRRAMCNLHPSPITQSRERGRRDAR